MCAQDKLQQHVMRYGKGETGVRQQRAAAAVRADAEAFRRGAAVLPPHPPAVDTALALPDSPVPVPWQPGALLSASGVSAGFHAPRTRMAETAVGAYLHEVFGKPLGFPQHIVPVSR